MGIEIRFQTVRLETYALQVVDFFLSYSCYAQNIKHQDLKVRIYATGNLQQEAVMLHAGEKDAI